MRRMELVCDLGVPLPCRSGRRSPQRRGRDANQGAHGGTGLPRAVAGDSQAAAQRDKTVLGRARYSIGQQVPEMRKI